MSGLRANQGNGGGGGASISIVSSNGDVLNARMVLANLTATNKSAAANGNAGEDGGARWCGLVVVAEAAWCDFQVVCLAAAVGSS